MNQRGLSEVGECGIAEAGIGDGICGVRGPRKTGESHRAEPSLSLSNSRGNWSSLTNQNLGKWHSGDEEKENEEEAEMRKAG